MRYVYWNWILKEKTREMGSIELRCNIWMPYKHWEYEMHSPQKIPDKDDLKSWTCTWHAITLVDNRFLENLIRSFFPPLFLILTCYKVVLLLKKVEGMEVGVTLALTDQQGTLKLSVLDCGCYVKDISIKLDGGASWLYQGYAILLIKFAWQRVKWLFVSVKIPYTPPSSSFGSWIFLYINWRHVGSTHPV